MLTEPYKLARAHVLLHRASGYLCTRALDNDAQGRAHDPGLAAAIRLLFSMREGVAGRLVEAVGYSAAIDVVSHQVEQRLDFDRMGLDFYTWED